MSRRRKEKPPGPDRGDGRDGRGRFAADNQLAVGQGQPGAPPGNRYRETHGAARLKRYLTSELDGRSDAGRALYKYRQELITALGGDVSPQQETLIHLAARNKLLIDSIDNWLLTQPSLINKRKRSLLPVMTQRQSIHDSLVRCLEKLGLERRSKDVTNDLDAYVKARYGSKGEE